MKFCTQFKLHDHNYWWFTETNETLTDETHVWIDEIAAETGFVVNSERDRHALIAAAYVKYLHHNHNLTEVHCYLVSDENWSKIPKDNINYLINETDYERMVQSWHS